MEVSFKLATVEDVPGIINLCNSVFDDGTDVSAATEIFSSTINDPNQIHLIGVIDGRIVSLIRAVVIPTMFKGMDTYAILNHVCVHPDFRRAHIGMKMLTECERILKERGCVSMKLWSKNFREPAHALYRKFGFESIDATFFEKEIENED